MKFECGSLFNPHKFDDWGDLIAINEEEASQYRRCEKCGLVQCNVMPTPMEEAEQEPIGFVTFPE